MTTVTTDGEVGVLKNLQRKAAQADVMFQSLVNHMTDSLAIDRDTYSGRQEVIPSWL